VKFSPGAALASTGRVWLRGLVPFTVFAFVVRLPAVLWIPSDPLRLLEHLFLYLLLSFGLDLAAAAGVAIGVFERLHGREAGTWRVFRVGFARLPAVAGVLFVSFLAAGGAFGTLTVAKLPALVVIALLLLAYPLLHLLVITLVAIPVAVVERPDTLGAFARAAELTHGRRLVVFITVFLVWGACAAVLVFLRNLPWSGGSELVRWTWAGIRAFLAVPPAVALGVVYHDLRAEEPPGEELAEIFE